MCPVKRLVRPDGGRARSGIVWGCSLLPPGLHSSGCVSTLIWNLLMAWRGVSASRGLSVLPFPPVVGCRMSEIP